MKKTILILMFLTLSLFAWDEESNYKNKDISWISYKSALKETNKKPMFIFVTANGCPYCEKAKDNMEENSAFKTYIGANFKAVKINKSEEYVPNHLDSRMTPAFYITDNNGKILDGPFIGLQPIGTLLTRMNMTLYKVENK